jgi:hypothetical protein
MALMKRIIGNSSDSLFDVTDGSDSTGEEVKNIAKHLTTSGIAPGLVGAGIGAASKKNKLRNSALGGLTGFALGAGNDAYHLGDNTREQFVGSTKKEMDWVESVKHQFNPEQVSEAKDRLKHNLNVHSNSYWHDYYYPPKVIEKLR